MIYGDFPWDQMEKTGKKQRQGVGFRAVLKELQSLFKSRTIFKRFFGEIGWVWHEACYLNGQINKPAGSTRNTTDAHARYE